MNAIPTAVTDALLRAPTALLTEPVLRAHAEDWRRIASLHQALVGQDDLTSTLAAFSGWLMPQVPHVLVALLGARAEPPLLVRATTARVPTLGQVAGRLAARAADEPRPETLYDAGFTGLFWPLPVRSDSDRLLLLRPGDLDTAERALLDRCIEELVPPLRRAARFDALYREARVDPLTGLANRRAFDEALDREHDRLLGGGAAATLVCCDLDHFKALNDRFGHPAGDAALRAVAQTISADVRATDTVARLGGDEFALLLPDMSEAGASVLAERLRGHVARLTLTHPLPDGFGLSTGVAAWRGAESITDWFRRADDALYEAKAARLDNHRPSCATGAPAPRAVSLPLTPFSRLALHAAED